MRGIRLERYGIALANHWYLSVWRLRIEVAEVAGGMDENVFLWCRHPPVPGLEEPVDTLETVCSVADMSEYPVGEPDPGNERQFFRANFLELDIRNQKHYEEAWTDIKTAVGGLVASLDAAEQLEPRESIWLGEAP